MYPYLVLLTSEQASFARIALLRYAEARDGCMRRLALEAVDAIEEATGFVPLPRRRIRDFAIERERTDAPLVAARRAA